MCTSEIRLSTQNGSAPLWMLLSTITTLVFKNYSCIVPFLNVMRFFLTIYRMIYIVLKTCCIYKLKNLDLNSNNHRKILLFCRFLAPL